MTDTPHLTVRVRRKDQNALLGFEIDHWHAYTFPTVDAAVSFGIGSAHCGWQVMFEDGTTLHKKEDNVAGKSLYGAQPTPKKSLYTKPVRAKAVPMLFEAPENTEWTGTHYETTMADGVVMSWDICGVCSQGARVCICARGVSAPNSIRYVALKTAGTFAGQKWEEVDTSRKKTNDGPTTYVQTWKSPTVTAAPKPKGKPLRSAKQEVEPEPIDVQSIDFGQVDSDAESLASSLEAQLTQRLGGAKSLPRAASPKSSATTPKTLPSVNGTSKSLRPQGVAKSTGSEQKPLVAKRKPLPKLPRKGR